ncbi:unnamed protein product [Cylicostephanus goldi]|uniref:Serpin domain-containing protein n=1 Tax=Cylicostephanus goldi TaxID=71465 RepID=A0A3P6T2I8_CYLGO|nr:unnamed protein product [Cylicostephanus goldi]
MRRNLYEETTILIEVIDDFVSATTEGKIKNFITKDVVKGAISLVVNAAYFKADWLYKFSGRSTTKDFFHRSENDKKRTEFMKQFETNQLFAENREVEVLSLPYKDRSYALNIFLPKKRFGLKELRTQLNGAVISNLLTQLKPEFLTISIPKMKIDTDYKLKEALMAMGVTDLFSKRADLSGISDVLLYVSDAAHRALIEVSEVWVITSACCHVLYNPRFLFI